MLCAHQRRLERRVRQAVHVALGSVLFSGFIGYSTAQAADAPPAADQTSTAQAGPDQLEQVTVEARFVREDAQQTPIAMSVITAADIEQRGLTQVSDVAASLPNVVFQPAGSAYGRSITAYIRGVGQQDSSFAFSPAVGFYIDDVSSALCLRQTCRSWTLTVSPSFEGRKERCSVRTARVARW